MENKKYRVLFIDVDGTLYYQLPVRLCMVVSLACYYPFHICRYRELFILRDFRKLRETGLPDADNPEKEQYRQIAIKWNVSEDYVKQITDRWMQRYPLHFLAYFRDRQLIRTLNSLHAQGVLIVVYSDYPAREKVKTLGLAADFVFSSIDREVGYAKPDRRAMENIMKITGCAAQECLLIGDRMEKDGLAAQNVGMDYLILKQLPWVRRRTARQCVKRTDTNDCNLDHIMLK